MGRAGDSLPSAEWLALRDAHAGAQDAIRAAMIPPEGTCVVNSRAWTRADYLLRPDSGRRLAADQHLPAGPFDVALVVADGLSPLAVNRHSASLLEALRQELDGLRLSPPVYVRQGRVAIGDEIGERMQARLACVLIGERPGLSAADSLGVYLTYAPRVGRTDAERNCISNVREAGLAVPLAGRRVAWLIRQALTRQLTGVALKEDAAAIASASPSTARGTLGP